MILRIREVPTRVFCPLWININEFKETQFKQIFIETYYVQGFLPGAALYQDESNMIPD